MKNYISANYVLILFLFIGLGSTNHVTDLISQTNASNQVSTSSISENLTIVNSNPLKYQDGYNLFTLWEGLQGTSPKITKSHLLITDMEGNVVRLFSSKDGRAFFNPKMINDSTLMAFTGDQIMFWNIYTNQTEFFDFGRDLHHDLNYNEESRTFLALEYNIARINGENMLTDRIVEYNREGDVLWEWFLEEHIDGDWYFDYSPSIENHERGFNFKKYPDPTHSNTLFWDMDNDKIYLNIRHLNQFYQIDHQTGLIDWYAGQNGNFTMYKLDGSQSQSLWYHSHDVNPLGNNEFTMFDNGLHNLTNTEHQFSSILKIKVDPVNWQINETFRWTPPDNYFSGFWGGSRMLENGNLFGIFGSTFHKTNTEFGGVAIEVNNEGEVVWEMHAPYGWGFYRMLRINPTEPIPPASSFESTEISSNDQSIFWFQPGLIFVLIIIVRKIDK